MGVGAKVEVGNGGTTVEVATGGGEEVAAGGVVATGMEVGVAVGKARGVAVGATNWEKTGRSAHDAWQPAGNKSRTSRSRCTSLLCFNGQSLLHGTHDIAIGQVTIEIPSRAGGSGVVPVAPDHLGRDGVLIA